MPSFNIRKDQTLPSEDGFVRVAYRGTWVHPISKKTFTLADKKFEAWKEYFTYLSERNETIPLVKLHSFDPLDRLGTIEDVRIDDKGFWIKPKYRSEEIKKALSDAGFSIYSSDDVTTFDGKEFEHALVHVGVTDYPVLKGLKENLAASFLFEEEELKNEGQALADIIQKETHPIPPEQKETRMPLTKSVAEALSVAEDASDEQILAAVKNLKGNTDQLSEQGDKLVDRLLKNRKSQIEALSLEDGDKKKLETFCTKDVILSEINSDSESMFDITLSLLSKSAGKVKEGDDEEEFLSGHQYEPDNSGKGGQRKYDPASLVDAMRQRGN